MPTPGNILTGVGKAIRKRVIKISVAALGFVGILLGLHASAARDWGRQMSFDFLDGRSMTCRIEQSRNSRRITRDVYSFEADFNDVCANLDSELSELGFTMSSERNPEYRMRDYLRKKGSSIRWINVRISDKLIFSAFPSPDGLDCHYEEGWVSIEIQRWQRQFWPPRRVLDHFHTQPRVPSKPSPRER